MLSFILSLSPRLKNIESPRHLEISFFKVSHIPGSGDLYSLGIRATSGVWRSLILSLGSIDNFLLPIRINPYRKGDYDRVSVYSDGKRVDWVSDLPPVEEIEVQGQRVKSTAKRDQYISSLVDQVNSRLGIPATQPDQRPQRRTRRIGRGISISSLLEDKK